MIQKNVDKPDLVNGIDSFESAKDSRPKDKEERNIIVNINAIDFQTLLAEQINR